MGFFFIPPGVALMLYFDIIAAEFWPIAIASLAVSYTHLDVYKRQEYLIILDSDCILPEGYFAAVEEELQKAPADAFGGPDRAHAMDILPHHR